MKRARKWVDRGIIPPGALPETGFLPHAISDTPRSGLQRLLSFDRLDPRLSPLGELAGFPDIQPLPGNHARACENHRDSLGAISLENARLVVPNNIRSL